MIAAVSTTPGVGVTSLFAMESAPYAPPVVDDINQQKGGGAGIWMSGMPPSTDGSRIFVASGNGVGHENKDTPASGRAPLSTLDEVIANFNVSGGKIALRDYFEPYEYIGLDAGDRDLGSGGVTLLDPNSFKGTNGVNRIAITIGKNGKVGDAPMSLREVVNDLERPTSSMQIILEALSLARAGLIISSKRSYPLGPSLVEQDHIPWKVDTSISHQSGCPHKVKYIDSF